MEDKQALIKKHWSELAEWIDFSYTKGWRDCQEYMARNAEAVSVKPNIAEDCATNGSVDIRAYNREARATQLPRHGQHCSTPKRQPHKKPKKMPY